MSYNVPLSRVPKLSPLNVCAVSIQIRGPIPFHQKGSVEGMTFPVLASFRASGVQQLVMRSSYRFFLRDGFHDCPAARSETVRRMLSVLRADDL